MAASNQWVLTDEDKDKFITALTENLPALRAKVGISQGDLAHLIGVSRQTYGAIEGRLRKMSWDTYLCLIFFFDYNHLTHRMLRSISAFPNELIERFNNGSQELAIDSALLIGEGIKGLLECLDEQALHTIRTVMMVEYARCTKLPGDAVIKSFNGTSFDTAKFAPSCANAAEALKKYKQIQSEHA
ncbi:MAG: helix-turn-helix domain-containing protein [Firmicutes bacterium]|nr:helix-turn-helix domain-containing protein [Bacillota bacterium]